MTVMETVASCAALPEDRGTRVEVAGVKILLVRSGAEVFAYGAECPHAGAPLENGAVCNGRIICPWHKGSFAVRDGTLLEPPALEGLARYPVCIEHGQVLVGPQPIDSPPAAAQDDPRTMVIVGNGAAGTCAAVTLRAAGFGGRVVLVGREPGATYDRTSLSKFVMSGEMAPDDVPAVRNPEFLARQHIETETAEVLRLDVPSQRIEFNDGRQLAYTAALVAPGGEPLKPDLPGVNLAGVHVLRSRADAAAIVQEIRAGLKVVILGDSFIGLEVASGLRKQRLAVTVVAPHAIPFRKQFGDQLGSRFKQLHEQNGVVFRQGQIARFEGDTRVAAVVLDDATKLPADLVILGTGVKPATQFIVGHPLNEDGGLAVDAGMQAANHLYAAGDIAAMPLPQSDTPVRIEHWRVAQQQARIAAHNMLGAQERFAEVPFFWTYHYGKRFEYLGHANAWDETVIDGDLGHLKFVALLVRGGQVLAVLACERERATALLSEALRGPLDTAAALHLVRTAP
jgi:NADPH-dependent 2,4-dienoyl-CoA reductase/sulfur reductase-like enzyme/nitrite reductase/ring-hydroxylating ferredoxin subunit